MLKKILIGGAIIAALGYYFVGGAVIAANQLQTAIEEKDGTKIVSLIDFESLREDLKADMMTAMAAESDDPMAMAFGGAMAGGMIDGMLQPSVIEQMINNGNANIPGTGSRSGISNPANISTKLGFMKFTINVADKGQEAGIILAPRGLVWKVVGVDIDMSQLQ